VRSDCYLIIALCEIIFGVVPDILIEGEALTPSQLLLLICAMFSLFFYNNPLHLNDDDDFLLLLTWQHAY
jgi:hypothetical protein